MLPFMLLLVKCCDNKMVKFPGGSSCRNSCMRLTKENYNMHTKLFCDDIVKILNLYSVL